MAKRTKNSDTAAALFKQLYKPTLSKGDQKRAEIAQVAYDLVDRLGVEHLTFDAIGKELGLKSAHIVYYFKDKRELLVAVFKILVLRAQELYVEALKGRAGKEDALKAYVSAVFQGLIKQRNSRVNVSLLFFYASQDEECRQIYLEAKRSGVERIIAMLEGYPKFKSAGPARLSVLAEEILVMLHGRILQCLIHQDDAYIRDYEARTLRDVRKMVADAA